jgi:hypothetical protein
MNDKRITALMHVLKVLDTLHIERWICFGTLLGLIRDNDLIPWDTDLDIGVMSGIDRDLLIHIFKENDISLIDDGRGSDFLMFSHLDVRIDINIFRHEGIKLVSLWSVPILTGARGLVNRIVARAIRPKQPKLQFWTLEGYQLVWDHIFPLASMNWHGIDLMVPRNSELALAYTYGENWKTPMKDFNWRQDGAHNAYKKG